MSTNVFAIAGLGPANTANLQVYLGYVSTGQMAADSNQFTNMSIALYSTDVGLPITIIGAGALDSAGNPSMLVTTVSAISGNSVTTAANSVGAVAGGASTCILFRPVSCVAGSIQWNSSLTVRDTMNCSIQINPYGAPYPLTAIPPVGMPILLWDHAQAGAIFGGSIDQVKTSLTPGGDPTVGAAIKCDLQCISWDLALYRRAVGSQVFSNQTIDQIIAWLFTFAHMEADGISLQAPTGPLILSCGEVTYDTVGNWLDNLTQLVSVPGTVWFWWTDPWRVVHLAQQGTTPAPFDVSDQDGSDGNVLAGVAVTTSREQYLNRAYVGISEQLTGGYQLDEFTGNGSQVIWYTSQLVGSTPEIYVSITTSQTQQSVGTFGADNALANGGGPGKVFYYNTGSTTVYMASTDTEGSANTWNDVTTYNPGPGGAGTPGDVVVYNGVLYACVTQNANSAPPNSNWVTVSPLTSSEMLKIYYQYEIVPTMGYSDDAAISLRAAVESGTGYYDQTFDATSVAPFSSSITASSNPSAADALVLAQAYAIQYGVIPQRVEISLYVGGLAIGMDLTVSLTDIGAVGTFLIDSVSLSTDDNLALWKVTGITGALINWDWRASMSSLGSGGGSLVGTIGGSAGTSGGTGSAGVTLTANGLLGIQADCCNAFYLPSSMQPTGVSAYVKDAPVGASINFTIYAGSAVWMSLSIAAGATSVTATAAQLTTAGAIPASVDIRLAITSVPTGESSYPGSDLAVFIYS